MLKAVRICLQQPLLLVGTTLLVVMAAGATPFAHADEPLLHRVTYTITADRAVNADIYFRDTVPPRWADYSHSPYKFSPKIEAEVGPDTRWMRDVMLADPDQWAMVSATSGFSSAAPHIQCQLAMDAVIVASNNGARGALCSLRQG